MKKILLLLSATFTGLIIINAQSVSVNTEGSPAHASSILDVKSTTKGMLVPRMSTAQRTAIVAPANGLLVYDTDTKTFWYHNGTAWTNITTAVGGGSFTLPYDATVNLPGNAFKIANSGTSIEGSSTNGSGVYGYSENGSGVNANSASGFGVLATSSQATAIRAFSSNSNPTIYATNTNATGSAISANSSLHDAILGTSAGTSKAGVYGTSTATNGYGVRGFSASGTGTYGSSNTGYGMLAFSNNGVGLRTSSTNGNALEVFGKLKIYGAAVNPQNGAVLTSDAEGNATWKLNRIGFKSGMISGNLIDNTEVTATYLGEEYDYSNSFNPQVGTFTAPITGVYSFGAEMSWDYLNQLFNINAAYLKIMVSRGGNILSFKSPYATIHNPEFESTATVSYTTDIKLQAGDVVWLRGWQENTPGDTVTWLGSFHGRLVFAE